MSSRMQSPFRSVASILRPAGLAVALLGAGLVPAMLTGCGSSPKVQHNQSVGQQLQDLDKSYRDGVINQKEYERLKRRIVRDND